MKKHEVADAVKRLQDRIDLALEWYKGCDDCAETRRNIRSDLDSLMREFREVHPCLKGIVLRLHGGCGEVITVRAETFDAAQN